MSQVDYLSDSGLVTHFEYTCPVCGQKHQLTFKWFVLRLPCGHTVYVDLPKAVECSETRRVEKEG